jgi:FAD/FMN-containing dehydrogenase
MSHEILATLRHALGPDLVQSGAEAGARYHVDFSHENACVPLAVVRPRTTDEVAAILRACHAHGQTLRRQYLHHSRNAAELDLMRRLKAALDPQGILNAARVLPE